MVSDGNILQGELRCAGCGRTINVRDGIPEFLHDLPEDNLSEIKSSEGVATYCYPRDPDTYNDSWLLSLPRVANEKADNIEGWKRKISTFDQVLRDCQPGGGKTLLDIGASTTWSTRFLARKGYDCIALDIVKGKYRGLLSSKVFFEHDNTYYECILAPMENIPLRNNSIDCVFSINSLHHSNDLGKVFFELQRILKPGCCAYILDDTVGFLRRKKKQQAAERSRRENQHNDHVYSLREYKRAIAKADLSLHIEMPQRYLDRIGPVRYAPKSCLYSLYILLSITLGMPFYFRVTKD